MNLKSHFFKAKEYLEIEHAVWAKPNRALPETDNHTNMVHLTLQVYKCTEITW